MFLNLFGALAIDLPHLPVEGRSADQLEQKASLIAQRCFFTPKHSQMKGNRRLQRQQLHSVRFGHKNPMSRHAHAEILFHQLLQGGGLREDEPIIQLQAVLL